LIFKNSIIELKIKGKIMRKTNEELDEKIAEQENLIADAAGMVDVKRGSVAKSFGQIVKNRREVIAALENSKEVTSVNLKAGI
jgi:hypothetical protein